MLCLGFSGLLREKSSNPACQFVRLDITDRASVFRSLKHVEYVIHLASGSLPKLSNQDPLNDINVNLIGGINILDSVLHNNVEKLIFLSSGGTVYGNPINVPIKESHPTNPLCSYGINKLSIEKYINLYRHLYGLNAVVLRLANTYGEGQRLNSTQGVVPVFFGRAMQNQPLEIWGDGSTIRDFIYIKDAVGAIISSLSYSGKEHTFNIGSGEGLSLRSLISLIEIELKKKLDVTYKENRVFDVPTNVLCIEKANHHLHWQPRISIASGLNRLHNYLLSN